MTGEGPGLGERADSSKISQSSNPSLALQASSVFALIGTLDVGDSNSGFRLVGPPALLAPFEKETLVEGRGGGLRAAVFFPSSRWLDGRRVPGTRTD